MNSITHRHHTLALHTEQHKRWVIFRPQVSDPGFVAITFKCVPHSGEHLLLCNSRFKPFLMSEGTSVWAIEVARASWNKLCKAGWQVSTQ